MKNKLYIIRRPDKRTRKKLKEMVRHYELKKGSRINNSYKFYVLTFFAKYGIIRTFVFLVCSICKD